MTEQISTLVLALAALTTGIAMTLSALLLIGFRRGRLRRYNIYIVFSIAALGYARFAEYVSSYDANVVLFVLVCWVNLAAGALIGLAGMVGLAKSDPPVWKTSAR